MVLVGGLSTLFPRLMSLRSWTVLGCVGWLLCRLVPEPHNQQTYDLFIGEVTAAWADDRVFSQGRWHFDQADNALRTIHHVAGGRYLVSGDTTPHAKPHPEPLFEAARRLKLDPEQCWYVGDDLRDIEAGKAAGMVTIAAAWGYCGDTAPLDWQADMIAHHPLELLSLLREKRA